ncbi:helix-turn-helix transcriptional regulator [Ramlibacter sp.]|uniref:helix-turn-helix domain-containing protein n=1 Tax=Ramlibacter sp. TaxID=1917967 RepID=UPI002B7FBD9B|nr:helix-turn-helix transcriptional regulator [Ramlibacter sp.]HWI83485.1 helix-turn-helix transcriptional regulator [Ramlibacter sp.]
MSPFAETLRALRVSRGLRQDELADLLHCDRSKISALENDLREGVSEEFVRELSAALALSAIEAHDLVQAARTSQRSYVVPSEAPPKAYRLAREIFDWLDHMPEAQLDALLSVLRGFSPATRPALTPTRHRVWRKDKVWKEESMP